MARTAFLPPPPAPPPGHQELLDRLAGEKYVAILKLARRSFEVAVNTGGGYTTDRVVVPLTKEECAALVVLINKEIE